MTRIALALSAVCIMTACGSSTAPAGRFGSDYAILLEPNPPALTAATVSLTVSYGGCRNNHLFTLQSRVDGGVASIWLRKVSPDESCDMLVVERRTFELPAVVQGAASILLLQPDGDPLQLRPDRTSQATVEAAAFACAEDGNLVSRVPLVISG